MFFFSYSRCPENSLCHHETGFSSSEQCFLAHFEALPPEQRITREANEKGISRPEVVGC